jgi:RND family efflux transporter MFP subunit
MHPDYVSNKPGDCPICGMRLVPTETRAEKQETPAQKGERKVVFYRNPMDPKVTSPVPKKDEMGMDYVAVYEDEIQGVRTTVPGMAPVEMDAQATRLSGVQTAVAERRTLSRSTRAVGLVTADESRIRHIHTKTSGWIEKLYVSSTGQVVRSGQPLLTIYSPELLASQEEYLSAREAAQRFSGSQLPEVRRGGEDLLAASRRRLELLDVPRGLIDQLDRTGKPQRTVTLYAPTGGYVTGKEIFDGMEVGPGLDLLTVTDLSQVWVEADFYEYESRALAVGQKVSLHLPYDPTATRSGRVSFIYPFLNPESRTVKVRIELSNPGLQLKPGMYVDVTPELAAAEGVVIPDSAVLDTGVRQVVFVQTATGFEPRQIQVGVRGDGLAMVLAGLDAGEVVAIRANFLLDSESRLRAAVAGMKGTGK